MVRPFVRFRRREPSVGWNPVEPLFLGFALGLLLLSIPMPWWGIENHVPQPRPATFIEQTVHFSPWMSTYWYSIVSVSARGAGFWIEGTPLVWWEFPTAFPQYAAFTPASGIVTALWSATFLLAVVALWTRAQPRRRMRSVPTLLEALAGGCLFAAILYSVWGFPSLGQFPSFYGVSADGNVFWGPGAGWYLAIAAFVLVAGSAVVGFTVDRGLRGPCWSCHRPMAGPTCGFCGSIQ